MRLFTVNGKRNIWALIVSVAIAEGVGLLSALFTMNAPSYYASLRLPTFAPPSSVFAPVWTVLYFLMGWAAYRVWLSSESPIRTRALWLYVIQLVLNFLWSAIFFGLQAPGLAAIEITLLLIFVVLATVAFYRVDRLAGYLMVPYVLWVAFAWLLNLSIWVLQNAPE